jgi:16S rRNA (uracil1498-N3)-methyltransferase
MPSDRYYQAQPFYLEQKLTLEDAEAHHLASVMRNRVGDQVELVNGQGQLAIGRVYSIAKNSVAIEIVNTYSEDPTTTQLILAQALPKMNRLEYILEKACELDIDQIWLFPGKLSEKYELTKNRLERINHILISALKQCGRLFLPKLIMKPALKNWSALPLPAYFGDLRQEAPPFDKILLGQMPDSLLFFIGPESGLAAEETAFLEENGVKGVKLHKNILRTDTAAIAACYSMSEKRLKKKGEIS